MKLNPPKKVRRNIYIAVTAGSLIATYLSLKHLIGDAEVGLWTGLVTLVTAMAGINTSK